MLESLIQVFDRAEERASEREERMRRMELEMEEKMREREERKEMQMVSMFTAVMQQMCGNASRPLPSPFFQPPYPYHSSQQSQSSSPTTSVQPSLTPSLQTHSLPDHPDYYDYSD